MGSDSSHSNSSDSDFDEITEPSSFCSLRPDILEALKHLLLSPDVISKESKVVDNGAFGDVTKALYNHPRKGDVKVAIKHLRIFKRREVTDLFEKEVYVWSKFDHPNILPLIGFFFDKQGYPTFVSKWMRNGSSWSYVKEKPDHDLNRLVVGAAKGLEYLHGYEGGVIHSDIKPDNIVVNSRGDAYICDFGVSRIIAATQSLARPTSGQKGTKIYSACELIVPRIKSRHTKKTDVWAFGMTIYALLTQQHPYNDDMQVYHSLSKPEPELPPYPSSDSSWSPQRLEAKEKIWEACQLCWNIDPSSRADMSSILSCLHGWVGDRERSIAGILTPPIGPKEESPVIYSPPPSSPTPPPPSPSPHSLPRVSPRSMLPFISAAPVELYTRNGHSQDGQSEHSRNPTSDEKPLPAPPGDDSPFHPSTASTSSLNSVVSDTSTVVNLAPSAPVITKRGHSLKELLSSERAYGSDLAFIRDVHIPMAHGKQAPFHHSRPITPPRSSGSSSRTLLTSSESSSSSNHFGPSMTKEEVRIIFGNITELAVFSDMFSERLEEALGDVLEDGKGEDWVGALFLEIIPQLEPPYMHYITKLPMALKHLNSFPKTPALTHYLVQTQSLASSVTHASNLPSLLIKPAQRLPRYSLLLAAIIEQTPDNHGDKENLKKAQERMEEVARGVNEGQHRMKVVRKVLTGKLDMDKPETILKKINKRKTVHAVDSRMTGKGTSLRASRPKEEGIEESVRVSEQAGRLSRCENFVREFAKDIVSWAQAIRASQSHLRAWAIDFGRTIGISEEQPSEAINAFMDVIDMRLMPLCHELDEIVVKELLPELARLLDTSKSPLRLLSAMHALEPLHNSLLNLNYSKDRPADAILEASRNYLALRGQLATDLPKYLDLLDKGIAMCIRQLARRQTEFWGSVREQWGELWDCLRMEGETNAGCEETLTLWWARYKEVEESIDKFRILKPEKPAHSPLISPSSNFSESSSRHRSFRSLDSSVPRSLHRSPSSESVLINSSAERGKSLLRTPKKMDRLKSSSQPLRHVSSENSANSQQSQRSIPQSTSHGHSRPSNDTLAPPIPLHTDLTPPPNTPPLYYVKAIHKCTPPDGAVYKELPFLTLQTGGMFGVLSELGDPSQFEGLCVVVGEGEEDCLLVLKNEDGDTGLALASFLVPVSS